jgi:hypothetical protein
MRRTNLLLFTIVVLLGVLANWAFAVWAIFFNTQSLMDFFGLGKLANTIWVYNYSVLLALLSCFYIPAAFDPMRYRANAWLLIAARLIPAATFFIGVLMAFMPSGFAKLGLGDATFGIIQWFLLRRVIADSKDVPAPLPV